MSDAVRIWDCPLELEVKEVSDAGTFAGYASVFGRTDLENEVVERGAFARTLDHNKGRFPLLWQHDKREVIGVVEQAKEDDIGLYVRGRLSMGVQRAKDAYALLKDGVIRGMSIGFRSIKDAWGKTGARHLKEIALHEVSLVTFAANPHAVVMTVKELETPLRWLDDLFRETRRAAREGAAPEPDDERVFDWEPAFAAARRKPVTDALDAMRVPRAADE